MKRTTTFNFLYMQQGVYNQMIYVSLGHRSTLNSYTNSFFDYYIFYLLVYCFGFPRQNKLHCLYTVQQEAHQNQAHLVSEKRRGDLGECMCYYKA